MPEFMLLAATTLPAPLWWTVMVFIGFVGACLGSFLNVVLYRVPRGESIVWPGSHCPKCKHEIRPWHNLPVAGWLLLRGRCYDCREAISIKYPLIELAVGMLAVLVALATPWL